MSKTLLSAPLATLEQGDDFIRRHLGPCSNELPGMLAAVGVDALDTLIQQTVPAGIRLSAPLALGEPMAEHVALARLKTIAGKNVLKKSLIGMGYYDTITPKVILRNVMENPGWYTAYTPYQAEIAQGRLEALLNFQQMVIDLTGLELANASLLDEATAAAEAMAMARRISKVKGQGFFVDEGVFPQTLDVVRTRAGYFGFELIVGPAAEAAHHDVFGALLQYPNERGEVADISDAISGLKAKGAVVAVASDLLALVLLKSPGAMGADIALGSAQRFGVPLGFGGPHAAFFATREAHVRSMPGRIIGVSKDARGKTALRMSLQTREQHIRREKANSNICTSQVLLANMAGMYAVYHGPEGLRTIAARVHRLAATLAEGLQAGRLRDGVRGVLRHPAGQTGARTAAIYAAAQAAGYNLRHVDGHALGISIDEKTTAADIAALLSVFGAKADVAALDASVAARGGNLPEALLRTMPSCPTRCSTPTTPNTRCCATSSACRTATSRWITR
jgi:glycine dehydrogenase